MTNFSNDLTLINNLHCLVAILKALLRKPTVGNKQADFNAQITLKLVKRGLLLLNI